MRCAHYPEPMVSDARCAAQTAPGRAYCAEHLDHPPPSPTGGHGYQSGPHRPDWGDGWADLTCDVCGATWVGPIGERCEWCDRSAERQRRWQAELTLTPPDVDLDDTRRPAALAAWGQRLRVTVAAGIVAEPRARIAYERERNR